MIACQAHLVQAGGIDDGEGHTLVDHPHGHAVRTWPFAAQEGKVKWNLGSGLSPPTTNELKAERCP